MNTTLLRQRTAPIREKRSRAISAFCGSIDALRQEAEQGAPAQRVRTFSQDHPSDLQRALELLCSIKGLALVVHGPAGCAATLHGVSTDTPWTVTAIDQRDSIMGGDSKLRRALKELYVSHKPRVIAIVATPVVAINNDDIESVTAELREELGIPIVPVFSDGFRSKIASTGHDVVVHAILKHLLPQRPRNLGTHINLLSASAGSEDLRGLQQLLAETGIQSLVFPRGSSLDELERVACARLSVGLDGDDSDYAGLALQDRHGVPWLDIAPPVGNANTSHWLKAVAAATGHSAQAALVAACHAHRLQNSIEALSAFKGARVFVNLPAPQAIAFADLLVELGLVLVGLKFTSYAGVNDEALSQLASHLPELPLLVGEGQAFEEVNLLRRLRPNLYIGRGVGSTHALRLGIPTLDLQRIPLHGYLGAERVAYEIARCLSNPALARFLGEGAENHYSASWLARSTHWYVKQEVK
jgi:nitrogenase molybdenum-iron protein alpha/beta subunit